MGNIKKFEEFNSVNEGLISWASKTFKPEKLDRLMRNIIYDIKENFDVKNLKRINQNVTDELGYFEYVYKNSKSDTISIKCYTDDGRYDLFINDDDVTVYVNKHYISDIWEFFNKKYIDITDSKRDTSKLADIKQKYTQTYHRPRLY